MPLVDERVWVRTNKGRMFCIVHSYHCREIRLRCQHAKYHDQGRPYRTLYVKAFERVWVQR